MAGWVIFDFSFIKADRVVGVDPGLGLDWVISDRSGLDQVCWVWGFLGF